MRKKLLTLLIVTMTCLATISGCGLFEDWKKDAKQQLSTEMNADVMSQVYLEGKVYNFPIKLSELLEDGWELTNFEDTYLYSDLEAHFVTDYISLSSPKRRDSITVTLYNNRPETIAIKDSIVDTLIIDNQFAQAMLPGGIMINDQKSNVEEIINMLGNDFERADYSDEYISDYVAYFTASNDCLCSMTAEVVTNNINYIDRVTYYLEDDGQDMVNQDVYLDAELSLAFHKDLNYYYAVCGEINDGENKSYMDILRENMAYDFMYYEGFELDYMNIIELDTIYDIFDDLYMSANWSIIIEGNILTVDYTYPVIEPLLIDAADKAFAAYDAKYGACEDIVHDQEMYDLFLKELAKEADDASYSSDTLSFEMEKGYLSDDDFYYLIYSIMGFIME